VLVFRPYFFIERKTLITAGLDAYPTLVHQLTTQYTIIRGAEHYVGRNQSNHDQPHFLASTTINRDAAMNATAAIPLMMLANGSIIPVGSYFVLRQ
jgi:hypothetical protein